MSHEERFIPPRQKLDPQAVVEDYAAVPRLDYRYVFYIMRCQPMMDGGGLVLEMRMGMQICPS